MRLKLIIVMVLFGANCYSQDLDSLFNLGAFTEESELQKIINQRSAISSGAALTIREIPGIVSIITAEEIRNTGARDLGDVLKMVPGFEIVQDLQFVTGIGLRGNWSNEGKVLVMVDGQEYNELMYQTVAVFNRFPVDMISRIEIIRGPGSALYGGTAEYGVINIITKNADGLNGVVANANMGFHAKTLGRRNIGVMAGQTNENVHWDVSVFKGSGLVSDQEFIDFYSDEDPVNLTDISSTEPMNINAGINYKGLSFRTIYDEYYTNDPTHYASFKSYFADLKYNFQISDRVTLVPQARYTRQVPWSYGYISTGEPDLEVRAERYYGALSADIKVSRKLSFNMGTVYFTDRAKDLLETEYFGENTFSMSNYAFFAQGLVKHRLVNVTAGFRFENNSKAGSAFVPRLALTKKVQNFHFKGLYSQSFRAPGIENINISLDTVNQTIKPEKSEVIELELGYQFTPEMLLTVNMFNIKTRNVIVYSTYLVDDSTYNQFYSNFDRSGTSGVEVLYSYRKNKWQTTLSYSHYVASKKNTVDSYEVEGKENLFVGFPAHKFTMNNNLRVGRHLNVNASFIYSSLRYAYTGIEEFGEEDYAPVIGTLKPYLLGNVFINYNDCLVKGLSAGIGVYDLFNQRPPIPQPYNGEYAPVPGLSREFIVKLSYALNFKD